MSEKEEKFKILIKESSDKILRICRYYSRTEDDAKDLYQEILINIWKSLDTFRGDSAISSWVYRIALNTSLGFASKQFKQLQFTLDIDINSLQILDSEHFIEDKQTNIEELMVSLNQLSIIDKTIISLVLEELSTKEISEIIGITEPNVRVKIHRIKEILKITMKGKNNE
jgi:RNA polymerase sigma-70 factor (ECF subfamily)